MITWQAHDDLQALNDLQTHPNDLKTIEVIIYKQ